MISYATACSGVESFSLAVDGMDMQALWFSEIEPHPCAVLEHHFPEVPNHGDMMRLRMYLDLDEIPPSDIFAAGTPCQAFSLSGLQNGLADPRGQLTLEYIRICNSNDEALKRQGRDDAVYFWENVPGVLSDKTNAFGHLLAGLAGETVPLKPAGRKWSNAGCVFGPQRAIAWRVLDAQYFGLAQRRKRVFLVASGRAGFDPAAVLFEFEGVRRDSQPRREERPPGYTGVSAVRTYDMLGFGQYGSGDLASTCKARDHKDATDLVVAAYGFAPSIARKPGGDICHALTAQAKFGDTSPHVVVLCRDDAMPAMTAGGSTAASKGGPSGQMRDKYIVPCLTPWDTQRSRIYSLDGVSPPLDAADSRGGGGPTVLVPFTLAFHENQRSEIRLSDIAYSLMTQGGKPGQGYPAIVQGLAYQIMVRRLMPVECERLMGMPDNWTQVPYRGKPAEECADGPRYKAIGNSKAVPAVRWIVRRMKREMEYGDMGL